MAVIQTESVTDAIQSRLHAARGLHREGQLSTAASLYQTILSEQPHHLEAQYLLGTLYVQQGAYEDAIRHLSRVLEQQPNHAAAHANLGNAWQGQGKIDNAIASYERAVALQPDFAEAHYNLGNALKQQGHIEAAVESYERAVVFRSDYAKAHNNLGTTLKTLGQLDAAEACFFRALTLLPTFAQAHNNLGAVLLEQGQPEAAIACFRAALELHPHYAEAHNNLGNALREQGEFDAAIASFQRALTLMPTFAEAHNNLGVALQKQGKQDKALASFTRAVELEPDYVDAHFSRATLWLARGNLAQGWPEYEWRLRTQQQSPLDHAPQPTWDGTPLAGHTILVRDEQGIGDALLFASCFPNLIAQAGHVVLECDPRLVSLYTRSFPTATVLAKPNARTPSWPVLGRTIDWQTYAGSLPQYLRPSIASFPAQAGFLVPDMERQAHWAARLAALGPGLKVGVAWRSLMSRRGDPHYTRLSDWEPVLNVPGVHLVNLQYDNPTEELAMAQQRWGVTLHAWDDLDLFNDFDEMAALIAALALVITPNVAVANLAGSVGQRVWRLTIYGGSWDMLGTTRYPWFPSVQVRCQPQTGDWATVLAEVARDLEQLGRQGS